MTPDLVPVDAVADLVLRDARPFSLRTRHSTLPGPLRVGLLVTLLLLHVGLLQWIERQSRLESPPREERLLFLLQLPEASPPAPPSPAPPANAVVPSVTRDEVTRTRRPATSDARAPALIAVEPRSAELRLYRIDGSLEIPAQVIEDLARVDGADRQFDFQYPGLVAASARSEPAPALEYVPSRFEDAWVERRDPITEALQKAVDKTTITVRIPMPRSPGTKYVCKITLAMMAGSCGFVNANDGQVVVLNDPETLNAIEEATCQAWWEAIVRAETTAQWQAARTRYRAECRKPREIRVPAPK